MQTKMIFQGNDRFPSSHAGSICELPNGDLLAAWYSGEKESSPDSVILGSHLQKGTEEWQTPVVWVDVDTHAAGNPRIFLGPDNDVWLISPINYGKWCNGGTRMFYKRSHDSGYHWTDLEIFPTRRRILGKNKPLHIPGKTDVWILPVEYEGTGKIAFMRSEDDCRHWNVIDVPCENAYLDQPSVVFLGNDDLLAYIRSWEGYIYETRSSDLGKTWTIPSPTRLFNPNSGIDMVYTRSNKLVLVFNPVALGAQGNLTVNHMHQINSSNLADLKKIGDSELNRVINKEKPEQVEYVGGYLPWGPRTPLVIGVSDDKGQNWRIIKNLENGSGEYSYPAIIEGSDGRIHILYTYHRTGMKYCCLDPLELETI